MLNIRNSVCIFALLLVFGLSSQGVAIAEKPSIAAIQVGRASPLQTDVQFNARETSSSQRAEIHLIVDTEVFGVVRASARDPVNLAIGPSFGTGGGFEVRFESVVFTLPDGSQQIGTISMAFGNLNRKDPIDGSLTIFIGGTPAIPGNNRNLFDGVNASVKGIILP